MHVTYRYILFIVISHHITLSYYIMLLSVLLIRVIFLSLSLSLSFVYILFCSLLRRILLFCFVLFCEDYEYSRPPSFKTTRSTISIFFRWILFRLKSLQRLSSSTYLAKVRAFSYLL